MYLLKFNTPYVDLYMGPEIIYKIPTVTDFTHLLFLFLNKTEYLLFARPSITTDCREHPVGLQIKRPQMIIECGKCYAAGVQRILWRHGFGENHLASFLEESTLEVSFKVMQKSKRRKLLFLIQIFSPISFCDNSVIILVPFIFAILQNFISYFYGSSF